MNERGQASEQMNRLTGRQTNRHVDKKHTVCTTPMTIASVARPMKARLINDWFAKVRDSGVKWVGDELRQRESG